MVGCAVSHLDARPLLQPLLPRLVRSEHPPCLGETLPSVRQAVLGGDQLAEDERDHVGGLPVGGVEQVRQRVGWEVGEAFRAVERVVKSLASPPLRPQARHRLHLLRVEDPRLNTLVAAPPAPPSCPGGLVEQQRVGLDHLDQAWHSPVPGRVLAVPGQVTVIITVIISSWLLPAPGHVDGGEP